MRLPLSARGLPYSARYASSAGNVPLRIVAADLIDARAHPVRDSDGTFTDSLGRTTKDLASGLATRWSSSVAL